MGNPQVPSEHGTPQAPLPARARGRARPGRWLFFVLAIVGLAGLSHVWYRGSRVDPHVYTAEELAAGARWQVIAWGGDRTAVQVSRVCAVPADRLWRVVTDQDRFDEFMPYVRSTTVAPGPDQTFIEEQILDLPHKSYGLKLEIRLDDSGGARAARWRQLEGDLGFNEGAWVVEPAGERSILRYQVSASVDWLPQWAVNYAMGRRLGRVLEAVERRVRDLEQSSPDYFRS